MGLFFASNNNNNNNDNNNNNGAEMGLSLNISKCELTAHSNLQLNDSLLQSFSRGDIADTTLLGAPLFPGPVLDST